MKKEDKKNLRLYYILNYSIFLVMFTITGLVITLDAPSWVQTLFKNLCAWISTFIIILMYKRFYPGISIKQYFKLHFGKKLKWEFFVIAFIIQLSIVILACLIVYRKRSISMEDLAYISWSTMLFQIIGHLLGGATGEELGWQGYALNKLQEYYSPIKATIIDSVLWGVWHFPILIISGYTGLNFILYFVVFLIALIAFSVMSNYFYNKTKNILISMWMHFLFNFFFGMAILATGLDNLTLLIPVCAGYCIVAIIILFILRNKKSVEEID